MTRRAIRRGESHAPTSDRPPLCDSRIALVTLYPARDRTYVQGVESVARALARALRASAPNVDVWADRPPHTPSHWENDEDVRIFRAWRKGIWAGLDLLRHLWRRRPAILHVQVEYFIYGGIPGLASIIAFLVASRLAGRKVVVTLHHVLGTKDLTDEVLRETRVPIPGWAARRFVRILTALMATLANRIIVHDDVFRRRLIEEFHLDGARVNTVFHGVTLAERSPPESPGPRYLLLFGYLKWYKGIDIALRGFNEIAKDFPEWRLIIAGGVRPRQEGASPTQRFLTDLRELAEPLGSQVQFTGIVDDSAIPSLFRRAEVILFPYRILFAFSGPLALAIGFRRPFILSEALRPLLPAWPLWCPNSPSHWSEAMRRVIQDESMRRDAENLLDSLTPARAWPNVAAQTAAIYREVSSL